MPLPPDIDPLAFDELHDDPAAWRAATGPPPAAVGAAGPDVKEKDQAPVSPAPAPRGRVPILSPPFLRDHFEFERAMLDRLHGRLRVPTPQLLGRGEHDGWPWLVMTQMRGEPLTASWPAMGEAERCALLHELGALAREVHALPVGTLAALAPRWDDFVARQRERCVERQRRTGLPPQLLEQLPAFVAGALPQGPDVLLTGEYTPFNLFTRANRLCAMFDFGDGLVGPREYDWLGPQCFLVAGDAARSAAFMRGVGASIDADERLALMRLLLLHRYSNLQAQVGIDGWQQARSFEELAARIWPLP